MAKLPSADDFRGRPAPSETPGIRAPRLDYSAVANAGEAVGRGLAKVGAAFAMYGEAEDKAQAHELDRKLLDFKRQTEMEYEQYKRDMQPGAPGYSDNWREYYRKKAQDFVGKDYANIPQRLRPHVDQILHGHDVNLHERSIRDEFGERDRKTLDDLQITMGRTRDAVYKEPHRLPELWSEAERVVRSSSLPAPQKDAFLKRLEHDFQKSAATSLVDGVKDADSAKAARDELAPHKPDKITSKSVAQSIMGGRKGPAAGWTRTNSTWQGLDGYQRAALIALMEADGTDINDARNALGAMINRAAKGGEDLGAHVSQKIYQPTIEPAQERRIRQLMASPKFKQLTEWAKRRAEGQEADPVNGATHFLAPERTMRALEAREPRKYRSWRSWTGYDDASGQYRGVIMRDKSHAFLAPEGTAGDVGEEPDNSNAYAGKFHRLSAEERSALASQIYARMEKIKKGVEQAIDKHMGMAIGGKLPPESTLNEIRSRVQSIKDPSLSAKLMEMEAAYGIARDFGKAPNAIKQAVLDQIDSMEFSTPEIEARKKQLRALHDEQVKALKEDPISWAAKKGISLPVDYETIPEEGQDRPPTLAPMQLERIDFNADPDTLSRTLAYRMDQAKKIKSYYGEELPTVKVFTTPERKALEGFLKQGGEPMLYVLGSVLNAAGKSGLDPNDVVREFSKDAPEVAMVGELIANGANLNDREGAAYRTAMALTERLKSGDKWISSIDRAQAKPTLGEYADVFAAMPFKRDVLARTADLLYEFEARRQKVPPGEFRQEIYTKAVRDLMGETTDGNHTYGGVAKQEGFFASWSNWRSAPKVMVPAGVRSDRFAEFKEAIRAQDLMDDPPLYKNGKTMPIGAIRSAVWISVGHGQYLIETPQGLAGGPGGEPYVLDVRPFLPAIQGRQPDLFMGYDGTQRARPEPDIARRVPDGAPPPSRDEVFARAMADRAPGELARANQAARKRNADLFRRPN